MSTPWGYGPVQFDVPAGQDQLVELHVPHRGTIRGINLQQLDGTADGVFEIYDSENAAKSVTTEGLSSVSSLSSSYAIEGGNAAAHSITDGEVTISGGAYRANDLNIPYINRDGSPSNCIRRLWMRINMEGSGDTTMALSMTIDPSDIN